MACGRPASAGLTFANQLENQRIENETTRHNSVLKEIQLERQGADQKLSAELKTCTTASCKLAQRNDNTRTQHQLDVEEEAENKAHAAKLAQIAADFGTANAKPKSP